MVVKKYMEGALELDIACPKVDISQSGNRCQYNLFGGKLKRKGRIWDEVKEKPNRRKNRGSHLHAQNQRNARKELSSQDLHVAGGPAGCGRNNRW